MSTILKALKQLENEKHKEPELTLSQQIAMTPPRESARSRSPWVLAATAVAGLAVAAVAVYLWLDPGSATDAESPAVAGTPTPAATQVTAKRAPSGSTQLDRSRSKVSATGAGSSTVSRRTPEPPRAASSRQSPTDSRVQVVQRLSPTPTPKPQLQPGQKARTDRPTSAAPRKEFVRRERHSVLSDSAQKTPEIASVGSALATGPAVATPEPVVQSAAPNSERATATKRGALPKGSPPPERTRSSGTVSARSAAAAATASEPAAEKQTATPQLAHTETVKAPPPVVSKPAAGSAVEPDHRVVLRARLPELKVRSTIWHPQGSRRVAMVEVDAEGVIELNEGDVIGPLVVESIKPGGVVFGHDGVSVLHKVGR